jgi:hypothetical protein
LVFDHPTPEALARHLLDELVPAADVDTELRALLATVTLDRLREIGVLEPLLRLVGRTDPAGPPPTVPDAASLDIDAMSIDDLVHVALNGVSDHSSG